MAFQMRALKSFNIWIFGLDREEPDVGKKFDSAKEIENLKNFMQ